MRAELSKAQGRRYSLENSHNVHVLDAATCIRVVLGPDPHVLVQMMRAENGPIACQVVKIVHDDSNEQVDDLQQGEM